MRNWVRAAAVVSALSLFSSIAVAAPKNEDGAKSYLVSFDENHPAAQGLKKAGFKIDEDWTDFSNTVLVKANKAGLEKLKNLPGVTSVDEEQTFTKMGLFNDGANTWGLQAVNAPQAWSTGATGQAIKVCILDTGINYNHPEFVRNGQSIIKGSKNFVNDGHPDATDGDGHGTHVAGTIAGQLNASGSYIGVAPGADLYIGRVLDDTGSGTSAGIMNGVKWCTDTVGAKIISMSLGGGRYSKSEEKNYQTAYNKGALIIAAAGNDGTTAISYPAGYAPVVSVGAVDNNLQKASFSQYNADVELAGPGVAVLSSVPLGTGSRASAVEGSSSYGGNQLEFAPTGTVNGPLVECGLADTTTSCAGAPTSGNWVAVVNRGVIAFSDKANNVIAQGADAMILANNDTAAPDDDGSFTFGAAGAWLPAVSISYNDGVALRAGGLGNGSVAITAWDYAMNNGTSMATPHVSAVAAVAWSARPTLTNANMRSILGTSAQDLGAAGRDTSFGFGMVKADAAANAARNY